MAGFKTLIFNRLQVAPRLASGDPGWPRRSAKSRITPFATCNPVASVPACLGIQDGRHARATQPLTGIAEARHATYTDVRSLVPEASLRLTADGSSCMPLQAAALQVADNQLVFLFSC